jgi:hypothetical protein
MANSPFIPDRELVLLLLYSIDKNRFPCAYDAHKSVPLIQDHRRQLGLPLY